MLHLPWASCTISSINMQSILGKKTRWGDNMVCAAQSRCVTHTRRLGGKFLPPLLSWRWVGKFFIVLHTVQICHFVICFPFFLDHSKETSVALSLQITSMWKYLSWTGCVTVLKKNLYVDATMAGTTTINWTSDVCVAGNTLRIRSFY